MILGARAGLPGDIAVVGSPPRRSELHCAAHARLDYRNQVGDIQLTLHSRHEIARLLLIGRILQVVQGSAISDGAHQRRQL